MGALVYPFGRNLRLIANLLRNRRFQNQSETISETELPWHVSLLD